MLFQLKGLLAHRNFRNLWAGQTISQFGSQITLLGFPLIAALTLQATPMEMGLLGSIQYIPFILFSLFAGVWVDRKRRRPMLIATDVIRACLILIIPLLSWTGRLNIPLLGTVSFLIGTCTVFFDIAYSSFLPSLLSRERLTDGNGKMEMSRSAAQILGPGMVGSVFQWMSAPIAFVATSIAYWSSAAFIGRIQAEEHLPQTQKERKMGTEIREGLRFIFRHRQLYPLIRTMGLWNLSWNVFFTLYVLYLTDRFELRPGVVGAIYGVLGVGVFIGASVSSRISRRFGIRRTIIGSGLFAALGAPFAPLAGVIHDSTVSVALLITGQLLFGIGSSIFNVNQMSLRQAVVPDQLQGRVNATFRFITMGMLPLGSLVGGALGMTVGYVWTLAIGAAGLFTAVTALALSPLRQEDTASIRDFA